MYRGCPGCEFEYRPDACPRTGGVPPSDPAGVTNDRPRVRSSSFGRRVGHSSFVILPQPRVLLPVFAGSDPENSAELPRKIIAVAEAHLKGDLGHAEPGVAEQ